MVNTPKALSEVNHFYPYKGMGFHPYKGNGQHRKKTDFSYHAICSKDSQTTVDILRRTNPFFHLRNGSEELYIYMSLQIQQTNHFIFDMLKL